MTNATLDLGMNAGVDSRPIFLLGTGRCGSTFQQRVLCGVPGVWIWGEHDAMLSRLLGWGSFARGSENLNRFSYGEGRTHAQIQQSTLPGWDATGFAWMNGFQASDIDAMERLVITSLMNLRLPEAKSRWGFKEIRYGPDDGVAERLLQLFPGGKIVHTLRHPVATIESCMLAWNFQRLKEMVKENDSKGVEDLYKRYANNWRRSTEYFLNLATQMPDRVQTSKLETFVNDWESLAKFLEIAPHRGNIDFSVAINSISKIRPLYTEVRTYMESRKNVIYPILDDTVRRAGYSLA